MLITIERMEALVAVIETGSFSAAARRMGKTPSALSRIVQHFEIDLGVELFERVEGQAPRATDTARMFYRQAVEIMPRLQLLENRARDTVAGVENKLVLAIHGLAFNDALGKALVAFGQEYPSVEVELRDPDGFDVDAALIDGEVDLVFMPSSYAPSRSVNYRRFAVMDWVYVAGAGHPLARLRGNIGLSDLLPHTQLMPTPTNVISPELHDAMRLCPDRIDCQRFVQIQQLLLLDIGFALLPRYAVSSLLDSDQLVELRCEVAGGESSFWDVEVRWTTLGPAGQWLLDYLGDDL